MKTYTYNLSNDSLHQLCIDNGWFTYGSNEQYEKLFRRNNSGAKVNELATIIWTCSDGFPLDEIDMELTKAMALPISIDYLQETLKRAGWGEQEIEIITEAVKTHPNNGEYYNAI